MKTISNYCRRLAISTLSGLLIFSAANSYADDTEIFFGGPAIDSGIRPNVLFILDNSGSMAWRTDSNSNPSGSQQSRMQVLKESFSNIINNAGAINAGIMVLNSRREYDSGRMVYPVSNIDAQLPGSVQQVASTPQIRVSGDDATQRTDVASTAVVDDNVLFMGNISVTTTTTGTPYKFLEDNDAFFQQPSGGNNFSCRMDKPGGSRGSGPCDNNDRDDINIRPAGDNYTGNPIRATALLYFRDIQDSNGNPLPAAAASDPNFEAFLELRPQNNKGTEPVIEVTVESSKTPDALNDNSQSGLDSRTYLSTAQITPSRWHSSQTARLDITQLVKQVLAAAPTTNPLDDLFIKLRASTNDNYIFCTRNCGSSNGVSNNPRVVINYSTTATEPETRMAGLRFQDVGIPQGATVTSARIDFAPAGTDAGDITFQIKAEQVEDAAIFTGTSNLTSRTPKTTALTSWSPEPWVNVSPPVHVEGPDVTAQVQEVVNLAGWCGNNAMAFYFEPTAGTGSRTAHSMDGAPGLQPTLTVTYTGGESGCLNPIIEASVTNPKNDVYEENDGDMVLGGNTLPVDRSRFAVRYENVPLVNAANILDVQMILTPANTVNSPNVATTVRFENANNSAPFTGNDDDITNRSDAADGSCVITNWVTGTPVVCAPGELRSGLQAVVNRAGWAPGNAISVMSVQSGDTSLNVLAYENNPAESIKLRIKVAHGGLDSSGYTVRQHLNALVQSMSASGGTPIVPTYYEAAQYLKGERNGFTSPITSACQTTHVVLLSDGQANGYSGASHNGIGSWMAGSCTGDAGDNNEKCGRSLAAWLAKNDQSGVEGDNFITSHTIGFALGAQSNNSARDFLSALANQGEGNTYTAENASELSAAFSQILQSVLSTDTTFVSPGAAVNQFNRQSNKNEVYFALFKPSESNRWVGNLKRYALNSGAGDIILDADNVGAVDPLTGFFKTTARSFWTSAADGNNTALGGVAHQLPTAGSRNAFTYIGTSPDGVATNLNATAHRLADANASITDAMLGAADAAERTELINWIRGLNTDGTARKSIGDPLHSVPRLVTYECTTFTDSSLTQCSAEDQSAFVGTNEGFVHTFDTNTGIEQLAFMPQELLGNIKTLVENANTATPPGRKYGMDNTVAVWVNDLNRNGVIYGGRDPSSSTIPPAELSGLNSGEFVYAYPTMGRGGRSIYALDVTDRENPKMLWFKNNASTGYERLGQTWSTPVVTKIDVNGTETQVLMFAGGYDPQQDTVNARTADSMGNAIYIVNAKTGALIWSASSATGHTLQLSKMLYSMPATLRVIDMDRDGLADQFFATDMGGQVWRFFINNGNAASSLVSPLDSGAGSTDDGVFADIIPADVGGETPAQLESKFRRFYNEPSVSLLTVAGSKTMVVGIGSGYRGHPLDKGTEDRFYSFRTPIVYGNAAHTVLTENGLYDATDNLIQSGGSVEKAAAASAFASSSGGWYIRLTNAGEKVLSDAITFSGQLFFNTYEPTAAANSCKAVQGVGRAYAVNLYDATPATQNLDGTPGSRFKALKTGGIPPRPIVLFPDTGTNLSDKPPAFLCIGTECASLESPGPGATYWIDES